MHFNFKSGEFIFKGELLTQFLKGTFHPESIEHVCKV